ncbi:glutathione S-transferase family protein [Permianibacter sp. IMCC34836]|uniref:glutathione S-transferase family protein n=1 Tax=Permianibacter fluminis TaxID=2738515 RepID=UPI001554D175|nr:glutathione S-transferase family protein [Permianibacter fluminis]NQD37304.1 glutathione S-transferase family protein [Permianibacter fluminis]
MYQLYGFIGSASLAPRMVLEELGLPYQFVRLDADKGEHKTDAYLKLNPNARVPTLVDGDMVLFESAAICLYLADRHPNSHLVPALTHPARGQLYKWLMFLTNSLQPALIAYFYPDRLSTDPAHGPAIKARAEQNADALYQQIDKALAEHGPYLLGSEFSVADLFLFMLIRWGRWFGQPPVSKYPHLQQLVQFVSERPAVRKTFELEGIPAPYCLLPAKA